MTHTDKFVYFWGCSDDNIELSGALSEEISGSESGLVVSNGLTAKIRYDGDWHVKVTKSAGAWRLHEAGSPEATEITGRDYTDVLEIPASEVQWVILGKKVEKR